MWEALILPAAVVAIAGLIWLATKAIDEAGTMQIEVQPHPYQRTFLTFGGACRACDLSSRHPVHTR